MRSNAAEINGVRSVCRGQVVAEYVIFMAVTLVVIAALVILLRTVGEHSERSVEKIGYSVP